MISIERWGRDHWSTFAYVAHWCAQYGTRGFAVNSDEHRRQMRVDHRLHPQFAHSHAAVSFIDPDGDKYPTKLAGGETAAGHDDYSCIEDMVAEGLVRWEGTGMYPVLFMTEKGLGVAAALMAHKTRGGTMGSFTAPAPDPPGEPPAPA